LGAANQRMPDRATLVQTSTRKFRIKLDGETKR
jgi:hypothetical protein